MYSPIPPLSKKRCFVTFQLQEDGSLKLIRKGKYQDCFTLPEIRSYLKNREQ